MNKILPVYNKKKRVIIVVLTIILLVSVIICCLYKGNKLIETSETEQQEKEYEEKVAKRDLNDNLQTMHSSIDLSQFENIQIAEDNTVSITDFGAIGDSNYYNPETNKYYCDEGFVNEEHINTQAIQNCLDYAQENNCNVKIPKGNYCIDDYILIPDNIEIIGEDEATFLIYDTFKGSHDDFVFRNKLENNQGILKIKNVDFKMESYKDFQSSDVGRYFLKFYDLKELSISDCEIDIENKGVPNYFTNIDIRGNFEKIDVENNTIINQNQSTEGGNLWIRDNNTDGRINEINITGNTIKKNGNDEALAVWGKAKMGNVNVKDNEIEYTNISEQSNDILIAFMGTDNAWNVDSLDFESNTINILGNEHGIMKVINTPGNINILKNNINNASTSSDSYGGVIKIANNDVSKMDDANVNIAENQIEGMDAVACRQIVGLQNTKVKVNNNNINAKVTYGIICADYNCERTKIELTDNNVVIELAKASSILSAKDNNIEFIANNNTIKNTAEGVRNVVYTERENDKYEYQKTAKQNITLTNNKFTNIKRILQNSDKNDIENLVVERNDFIGIVEVMYESRLKNIFTGEILIKDNYFDNKDKEKVMNINKTDLSQVESIQTETNYYINRNIDEVANSIIEKYNQFKNDYNNEITENNISNEIEEILQYINTVKETQSINATEMVDKINKHYNLGNIIINNCKEKKNYDNISKVAEQLAKLEEIAEEYSDLLIVMSNSEQENIENIDLTELENLINGSSDLGMEFVTEKLQKCKDYNSEIQNINNYEDSNTKWGLLLEKSLYITKISKQIQDLANLYIDKYISENPITLTYSIPSDQLTNQDVKVTVNKSDDTIITNNEGSNEKIFTANGYFVFTYTRRGRNEEIRAEVNNIDKEKPEVLNVGMDRIYTESVSPKVVDEHLEKVELYKENNIVETYENGSEISEEGTYKIVATDKVGNETTVQFFILEKGSTEYIIQDNYIKNIFEQTKVEEFKQKISVSEGYTIKRNGEQIPEDSTIATGDELEFNDSKEKYTLILLGDINKDGELKIKDFVKLRSYILGKIELDDAQKLAADTNLDNKDIGVRDLVRMRIMLLNK